MYIIKTKEFNQPMQLLPKPSYPAKKHATTRVHKYPGIHAKDPFLSLMRKFCYFFLKKNILMFPLGSDEFLIFPNPTHGDTILRIRTLSKETGFSDV